MLFAPCAGFVERDNSRTQNKPWEELLVNRSHLAEHFSAIIAWSHLLYRGQSKELRHLIIKNHTELCNVHDLITDEIAYELMVNYLNNEGYDMSGFIRQ